MERLGAVNRTVNRSVKIYKLALRNQIVMSKEYADLTDRILRLLEKEPGQPVQELAWELKVNRTFLAGYLKALENQGYVKSKGIGPAKVYFINRFTRVMP
jgi:predicted transcriptional regulator